MSTRMHAALCVERPSVPLVRDSQVKPDQLTRDLSIEVRAGSIDESNRTVELSFSSEEPYERWWGNEILDHQPSSIRLQRLNAGGALLMDHNSRDQVGVVERASINGGRGQATVRFGRSPRAQEVFDDVKDGIRKLVSVGYRIHELILEKSEDGAETYRATDWEPYEISLVAVPADPSVGVDRDGQPEGFDPRILIHEKEDRMPMTRSASAEPGQQQGGVDASRERDRILNIRAMGEQLGCTELADAAIKDGRSFDQFALDYRASCPSTPLVRLSENPVGSDSFESAKADFSLTRAIRDMVEGGRLTGREAEVSQELRTRNGGATPEGVYVPTSVLGTRAQFAGVDITGGNLVGDNYRPDQFVQPLRKQSVIMESGATILSDLVGNAVLPRQDNETGGTWIAEDAEGPETDLNFSQIVMTPKTVTGRISWTRQAALQALPAMEDLARRDLAVQLGLALDEAAIAGTGAGNQPVGILNTAGIGSVQIGANGGAPEYSHIVDLESALADQNADMGSLAYLTNSKVRGKLKKTEMFAGTSGRPVWSGGTTPLNGYRALVSNNAPDNLTKGTGSGLSPIIFGNWSELLIGLWGALDLIVDPYTFSSRGRVRISAFLSADISVRHAQSFAAITDAQTE